MKQILAALFGGTVFGFGLAVAQMIDPRKILNFLDFTGIWDPSLAFVMGGAFGVMIAAYAIARRTRPLLAAEFQIPKPGMVDVRLLAGAALFGLGWGLVGFCPGPALAALAYGVPKVFLFVAAMAVGIRIEAAIPWGRLVSPKSA